MSMCNEIRKFKNKNSQISQKETYKENLDKHNAHWESIMIHIIFRELHYCSSA